MLSLLALETSAVANHGGHVLCVSIGILLLSKSEWRLVVTSQIQTVHHSRHLLVSPVAQHIHAGTNRTQAWNRTGTNSEGVVHESRNRRSGRGTLSRRWLISAWRCDTAETWLTVQTVRAGVVVELVWQHSHLDLAGERLLLLS